MRMGVGTKDNMNYTVSIAVSDSTKEDVLGFLQVPEDEFIDALGRLFPRGELDGANMEEGPEDRADLLKEREGLEDLTSQSGVFDNPSDYHTAMARLCKIDEILEEMDHE
jgi:hypothetical protein